MANFQELTIGSVITFLTRDTQERYEGAVYEFKPIGLVGLKNVSAWTKDEKCELSPEKIFYFPLRDIVELQVIGSANKANTNQDGKNNDGSSSKSTEGKM